MAVAAPLPDAPPCPWPTRSRARLAAPANPDHPRRGRVGEVMGARWFVPSPQYPQGCWLVRIRFSKASWDDWRDRRKIDDEWLVFGDELEARP